MFHLLPRSARQALLYNMACVRDCLPYDWDTHTELLRALAGGTYAEQRRQLFYFPIGIGIGPMHTSLQKIVKRTADRASVVQSTSIILRPG